MLTSPEQIRTNILAMYDPRYYTRVRKEQLYAFGDKNSSGSSAPSCAGDLPDWGDTTPEVATIGESRRIANAGFWALTSIMQQSPKIKCPDVPMIFGDVRTAFFAERYGDNGSLDTEAGEGGWATEHEGAFMDGQGHGMGWIEHHTAENPESGMHRVALRHSPILQTFWDRTARNPAKARCIAFVDYIDMDEAVQLYGKEKAEKGRRNTQNSSGSEVVEQCRVIRYYDRGWAGGDPTTATLLGSLDQDGICYRRKNPIGNVLPSSYYLHCLMPGMMRAIGQIAFQMPTQEMLNMIEMAIKRVLKMQGFQGFDVSRFNTEDLPGILSGKITRARMNPAAAGTNTPAVEEFSGLEVASSLFAMYQLWDRQYTADSNQNDLDRGNTTTKDKTLGEVELMDQRSKVQQSWSELQSSKLIIRSARVSFKWAAKYDRDPLLLDVYGRNILVNDPQNPVTWMDHWLHEPSRILLDSASLKAVDADQEAQRVMAKLAPALQLGANPQWALEKYLDAIGEEDKAAAMAIPMPPPGMPGDPAMAGAPQVAA